MSVQTELTRITNAKAAIKTAVEGKGVTVPDGAKLDALAALIESIEAGGGGADISPFESIRCGTFVGTTNEITIDGVSNCKIFAMRLYDNAGRNNGVPYWTISAVLVNYNGSRVGCSLKYAFMQGVTSSDRLLTISGDTLTFNEALDGDYEYIMVS